jgi:hypothetical protein
MAGRTTTPPTWPEALAMLGDIDLKLYSYTVEADGISPRDLAEVGKASRAMKTLQKFILERSRLDERETGLT